MTIQSIHSKLNTLSDVRFRYSINQDIHFVYTLCDTVSIQNTWYLNLKKIVLEQLMLEKENIIHRTRSIEDMAMICVHPFVCPIAFHSLPPWKFAWILNKTFRLLRIEQFIMTVYSSKCITCVYYISIFDIHLVHSNTTCYWLYLLSEGLFLLYHTTFCLRLSWLSHFLRTSCFQW